MSFYRDLQLIYENAWRTGPNAGRFYTGAQSSISMSQNPGTLPVQSPSGADGVNAYRLGIPAEQEEDPVQQNELIYKRDVIEIIDAVIKETDENMTYALHQLAKIREMVKEAKKA